MMAVRRVFPLRIVMLTLALVLGAGGWSASAREASVLTLSKETAAATVIIVAAGASDEERTAAAWLTDAIRSVTGAVIDVCPEADAEQRRQTIYVGRTQAARDAGVDPTMLADEEWLIRARDGVLILAGGEPRGTLYAVCEFLESGPGVYRLDPFTSVIPQQAAIAIAAMERRGRPVFRVRNVYTAFPPLRDAETGLKQLAFEVWNKNNAAGRAEHGWGIEMIPEWGHTYGLFISPAEFGAGHPEYFSMDADGRRMTKDMGSPRMWQQLCVTNGDVRRIVVERSLKFIREDRERARLTKRPPARRLVISQNDNTTNLCLCPPCQAITAREGSESGLQLDFVNHVAREIKTAFPDVAVMTDAYNFTLSAPRSIRPEENVVVRFCDNYGRSNLIRPLTDPSNATMRSLVEGWRTAGARLAYYDYWRMFPLYPPGFFAPFVNIDAIAADVRLFRELGVEELSVEVEDYLNYGVDPHPHNADLQSFNPLRAWLGMKLLDDPERPVEPLLDVFFRGYYGRAAQPMRRILDLIGARQRQIPERIVDVQRQEWARRLCNAETLVAANRLFEEALALVGGDRLSAAHVQREWIVFDSTFLWIEGTVRRLEPGPARHLPAREQVLARHRDNWMAYLDSIIRSEHRAAVDALVEKELRHMSRLSTSHTDPAARIPQAADSEMRLDGRFEEPVWSRAPILRLAPGDFDHDGTDNSSTRLVWSVDGLYVAYEQPREGAAEFLDLSLWPPPGSQLIADIAPVTCVSWQPAGRLGERYSKIGLHGALEPLKDRSATARLVAGEDPAQVRVELFIPWADVGMVPQPGGIVRFQLCSWPKSNSAAPRFIWSPWTVGIGMNRPPNFGELELVQ